MDQVTAVVHTISEDGHHLLTTEYLAECGCEWVVDMWGNVRRVRVCPRDMQLVVEEQLEIDGAWILGD